MSQLVLSLALCYFVLVFFSPFSIVITSLGESESEFFTGDTSNDIHSPGHVIWEVSP